MKVYHLFSSFVWKNVTRRMIVFGLMALASGFFARAELTGNWVTLTNHTINAVGVMNGWNASYWDDGRDPHVDADYLVNAKTIHSPKWGNNSGCKAPTNCVFGGNSLWLTNGATLAICTVDTTFSDSALIRMTLPLEGLNIASGGKNVIAMYDYGEANVFGLLEVQPGATLSLEASAHAMPKSKVLNVRGTLLGASDSVINLAGNACHYTVRMTGDCGNYHGVVNVNGKTSGGVPVQTNELELGSVTIPGKVSVAKCNRLMLTAVESHATIGSVEFKSGAILAVPISTQSVSNGAISIATSFEQKGDLTICITNTHESMAKIYAPARPVLKIAANAESTLNLARIGFDPLTDSNGETFKPFVVTNDDSSLDLYVGYDREIGDTKLRACGDVKISNGASGTSVTVSGMTSLSMMYGSVKRVLNAADFWLDANDAGTITFVKSESAGPDDDHKIGLTDPQGRKYIDYWVDKRALTSKYLQKWGNTEKSSTTGDPIRRVSAHATVQTQEVNGVSRTYVDFGTIDGSNGEKDTNQSALNENGTAMQPPKASTILSGKEFHIVHVDAHENVNLKSKDGQSWRPVLIGRTNVQATPNKYPGRRGTKGELFYAAENDEFRQCKCPFCKFALCS